ncbi:MAG: hypothetical protein ABIK09_17150 [Pseudomonadota bacterium]
MRTAFLTIIVALLVSCGSESSTGLQDIAPSGDTPFSWDLSAPVDTLPMGDTAHGVDTIPGVDTVPGVDAIPRVDAPGPDTTVSCDPGTQCWADEWVIMASKVTFVVDGVSFNPDWFLLDLLPPGLLEIPVEVRSTGMNPLNLVSIFLEDGGNPHVSLHWPGAIQPGDLPLELMAQGTSVPLIIRYAPPAGSTEAAPTFLTVWSGDPDHPSRSLKLPVKQPGPDIDAPLNWSNFGCSVYCMDAPFEIYNSGTEALVIQSTSFKKPSGEWGATPAIPGGLTLVPAGQPGTTSFAFEINYCDADGSYGNDSNEFQIFSNDPDENPYNITLTVQPPDECP